MTEYLFYSDELSCYVRRPDPFISALSPLAVPYQFICHQYLILCKGKDSNLSQWISFFSPCNTKQHKVSFHISGSVCCSSATVFVNMRMCVIYIMRTSARSLPRTEFKQPLGVSGLGLLVFTSKHSPSPATILMTESSPIST